MRRVILFFCITAAIFCAGEVRAQAITEICPARLELAAVGQDAHGGIPANQFGFRLVAGGARNIAATLVLDTDKGWYTAAIPSLELQPHDVKYNSPLTSFTRREFDSPKMYVDVPQPVTVQHAYLAHVSSNAPAWNGIKDFTCWPTGGSIDSQHVGPPAGPFAAYEPVRDPKADARLNAAPLSEPVLQAQSTMPLASANCAQPFRAAVAKTSVVPDAPDDIRRVGAAVSVIDVVLDQDGHVMDTAVRYPSGGDVFDREAMFAAAHSQYVGAIAYCQPVKSEYVFHVTFIRN